jgi:type IV pilus assembly protein PilB
MLEEEITITSPLLELVLEEGMITDEQAADLLEEQDRTGNTDRVLLLDMDLVKEADLLELIASYLGANTIDLSAAATQIDRGIVQRVPASVVRMYNMMPINADENGVLMATYDIVTPEVVDELTFVLTRDVSFVVASEGEVKRAIRDFYGDSSESVGDMLSLLESELEEAGDLMEIAEGVDDVIEIEAAANQTPVVRFVNLVLFQAVQDRASDIHFEPFENDFKIRYRVDGALYEMSPPPKRLAMPVISRVKVVSGLNIAERRLPQDGRIKLQIAGRPIDFRVSCLPTQFGESVVLRVLDQSAVQLDLDNIGMPDDVYETFSYDIKKPNGIVIVTGPTGSGKTTTLYSALRRLNNIETKILTAEDPVEYDVEGLVQIPINEAIGLSFAKALRAFLRQDPDVILVGETRDLETAQIAVQASLTGHIVFTTLHTNDAPGAITRLVDMGVEPFLIASTLEGVMGQRLIRTICKNCKTEYKPDAVVLDSLGLSQEDVQDRSFYFGAGCNHCNNTGYRGRAGIFEYLRMTDPIRQLINDKKPTVVIRDRAIEMGMRTLREDGVRAILDGITTVEEVLKYT